MNSLVNPVFSCYPLYAMTETSANNSNTRPPIVVVVGHVDHGKTTLLDYIRKSEMAAREAGGITQAIAAYEIEHDGKKITFIDTPGHEAFTKMRQRGAAAADLAILVIAAEEGLKPQTKEAIEILQSGNTPFIVAFNKVDKPEANVEKVRNELMAASVFLEGFGGQVSHQEISAKTGQGVDELLDLILLAAEVENLTYDPKAPASGYVLEARMNRQRGMEVAVIVKNGALNTGDTIATQTAQGKVRILENFLGKPAKQLVPSSPALIVGFEKLPQVGEEFFTGNEAQVLIDAAKQQASIQEAATVQGYRPPVQEEFVTVILKASDSGSLEAISEIVKAMQFEKPVKIVAEGVGEVNDNDVKMSISSGSLIIGFKTKVNKAAEALSQVHKVRIVTSEIIYELLQKLEELARANVEEVVGELEVLAVFNQQRLDKQLVGGKVLRGVFKDRQPVDIRRAEAQVGMGRIVSMRQQKKEVTTFEEGQEGGIVLNSPMQIEVGDKLVIKPAQQ